MVAEKRVLVIEKTRISYADAIRSLVDDADHRNQFTDAASSAGRDITRVVSRERVSRMLSLEGKTVAICAPSGLGMDCADAMTC